MAVTTCTISTTTTSSVMPMTNAGTVLSGALCQSNLANTLSTHQTTEGASLENRCQLRIGELPEEMTHPIFMQCLASGDIKGFMTLGRTSTYSHSTMRYLVNKLALTQLCPNLRILDAKNFKFQADLGDIDKYKTLQSYYKLEPFVEDREGLTIIFNQGGRTLKDMKENPCGVAVHLLWGENSEAFDNLPEEDTGPQMICNAPITETRSKTSEAQETRVRDEVGFDGKQTLIQSLALLIATQKELGICLYRKDPNITYGRISTQAEGFSLAVGNSAPGHCYVIRSYDRGHKRYGAGGRLKL